MTSPRQVAGLLVSGSISGHWFVRRLTQICEARAKPGGILGDSGTQFTSKSDVLLEQGRQCRAGLYPARQTHP